MTSDQFLETLIESYPPEVRPDAEYIGQLSRYLKRRNASSRELEEAVEIIRTAFRRFPSISDIQSCLSSAHEKVYRGVSVDFAYDYFDIDGAPYRRRLNIDASGEIIRLPVPYGAQNYVLWAPAHLRHEEFISAEQALREGCLSESLYKAIRSNSNKSHMKARFEKIGAALREEDEEDIDDSMAANPEEPIMVNASSWDEI